MTAIRPFRGFLYDTKQIELSNVVVPPYDVIPADEREHYYERDPRNAIRLELTRNIRDESTTDYSEVRDILNQWKDDGVLMQDATPCLYGLRQTFDAPDGTRLVREGFFAALELAAYDEKIVLPHERTLAGPKADRLKILRATRANLSSVFMLYEDREQTLAKALADSFAQGPDAVAKDEAGVEHAITRITDPTAIAAVQTFMAGRSVVIADGHHRYETALAYRDEQRSEQTNTKSSTNNATLSDAAHDYTLAYFANAFAPGSLLLPIHRVILEGPPPSLETWQEKLSGWQRRELVLSEPAEIANLLDQELSGLTKFHAFIVDEGNENLVLYQKPKSDDELSIRVIHQEVIEGVFGLDPTAVRDGAVSYPKSALRAAQDVRSSKLGAVGLYLNPLTPDEVFQVTGAGEILPQKSTFFLPKLPSGLVFRLMEESW